MAKKGTIVFVDDDPIILETLEIELEQIYGNKYIFESAMNAKEALDIINVNKQSDKTISLVISDWLMPGMKGDEFLIEVYKRWPDIRCMMLTGQANEESIQNAINNSGMTICLRKPWTKEELIITIKNVLS